MHSSQKSQVISLLSFRRKGLFIIDLENPYEPPRFLHHLSKWEVADVQWSPHIGRQAWIASTSNQKALVWNLEYTGSRAIEHILHAHSRAISDINWSAHHEDLLATCSVDTFVHLWDLRLAGGESSITEGERRGMRPAVSLCAWTAGATQVKFNRKNEFLLASAHDSDIKIWDIRKGSLPVTNITAHRTKIYGIDWSRQHEDIIVTCSLDKLVKVVMIEFLFWNINQPNECVSTITTNSPVWRARHTPFGNGILTMPQRSEVTLSLWNYDNPEAPAYLFRDGHSDTVKEFVWRWLGGPPSSEGGVWYTFTRPEKAKLAIDLIRRNYIYAIVLIHIECYFETTDDREFQLVTWSKDQHLRLWPISPEIMKTVNHIPSPVKTGLTVPFHADTPEGNHGAYSFRDLPHCSTSTGASPSPAVSTLHVLADNRRSTVSPLCTSIPSSTGVIDFADAPAAGKTTTTSGSVTGVDIYRVQPSTDWNRNSLLWMKNVKTVRPTGEAGGKDGEPEGTYRTLAEELTNVAQRFIGMVKFETLNVSARFCTVTLHGPWSDTFLRVTITFPPGYPDKVAPVFDIQKNAMISMYYRTRMQQVLNSFADNLAAQRRPSLEACLRYLLGETSIEELDSLGGQSGSNYGNFGDRYGENGDSDDEVLMGPPNTGGLDGSRGRNRSVASDRNAVDMSVVESLDQRVPFPRLCGAHYVLGLQSNLPGRLVAFFSTLRVYDTISNSTTSRPNSFPKRSSSIHHVYNKGHIRHPSGSASRSLQPTFSDYYRHPCTYDQLEMYKEIAASSKPRNTGAVNGNGFGTGFDEDPDEDGFGGVISSVYNRKVSWNFASCSTILD
ncbi:WD40-repeat-containing domain protein [Endogone sp. FLAS-F59071]|nr:WD40-repeat-containing domain protein [Endogone sp. FLAS-F59071]|eukprot:RUS17493.1 WD40-repeat-containing domain protein [Endogone sp. FLAS-F59071]